MVPACTARSAKTGGRKSAVPQRAAPEMRLTGPDASFTIDHIIQTDCPPQSIPYEYLAKCTDDFRGENRIGRGAFGDVYKASDKELHVSFAVKRVRCNIDDGSRDETVEEVKKQFEREIKV